MQGLRASLCLLLLLPAVLAAFQTSSSSSISISSQIRLRSSNRLRRPESCREQLPRKSEDLPSLVIVGRVKEVYLASNESSPVVAIPELQVTNKALVSIGRVVKGNQQLVGSDIIVGGFNSSDASLCPNSVKPNDTLIFLLDLEADRRYSVRGGNILSMNLNNLDRINAVAADEPFKRRPPIEDILCEAHYCPYGRCAVDARNQTSCLCPDSCSPLPSPVCGSDNATYTSECHLIQEGCRLRRPLFVTKESTC